jgi:hypothetical protein
VAMGWGMMSMMEDDGCFAPELRAGMHRSTSGTACLRQLAAAPTHFAVAPKVEMTKVARDSFYLH